VYILGVGTYSAPLAVVATAPSASECLSCFSTLYLLGINDGREGGGVQVEEEVVVVVEEEEEEKEEGW
jgi:hypothetical protein